MFLFILSLFYIPFVPQVNADEEIGYSGANDGSFMTEGDFWATQDVATQDGTVSTGHAQLAGFSEHEEVRMAVYYDNEGQWSLLGASEIESDGCEEEAWVDFTFSPALDIEDGVTYVVGINSCDLVYVFYKASGNNWLYRYGDSDIACDEAMPDPMVFAFDYEDMEACMYLDVEDIVVPPPEPCCSECQYAHNYINITIDHDFIDNNLINFPILVNLSNDIVVQADGGNSLRFYDEDCNLLAHEIDYWDSYGLVWVNVTNISSTVNTTISCYYNDSDLTSVENPSGVWDSGFTGVWHMNEASGNLIDSTSNGYDGVASGNPTYAQDGGYIPSSSITFDGTGDYFTLGASNLFTTQSAGSISAWVKDTGGDSAERVVTLHKGAVAGTGFSHMRYTGTWSSYMNDGSSGSYLDSGFAIDNSWHHIVFTGDDTTHRSYMDGIAGNTQSRGLATGTYPAKIGTYDTAHANYDWYGMMDEVRISKVERNVTWTKVEYYTMNQTSGFLIYGDEQSCPDAPYENQPPVFSNEYPADGATDVALDVTVLHIDINDTEGDAFNYSWGCSDGSNNLASGNTNGTKYFVLDSSYPSLDCGTVYTWWVNASEHNAPQNYTNESYTFTTRDCEGEYSDVHPENASSNICPCADCNNMTCVCINASHESGNNVNISFYSNHSGDWLIIKNYDNVSGRYCAFFPVEYDTTYYWYANVSEYWNESSYNQTDVYIFTTGNLTSCALTATDSLGFSDVEFLFLLVLSMFFLFMLTGYESRYKSGGAFMVFAGFIFLYLEVLSAGYLSPVLIIPLMTPFAVFIILIGFKKYLYTDAKDLKRTD